MLTWGLKGLRPIWPTPHFVVLGFCVWRLSRAHLGLEVCFKICPLLGFGFLGFCFVKVEPCSPGFGESSFRPPIRRDLFSRGAGLTCGFEV